MRDKKSIKHKIGKMFFSLFLGGETILLLDFILTIYCSVYPPEYVFPVAVMVAFLLFLLLPINTFQSRVISLLAPLAVLSAFYLPVDLTLKYSSTYKAARCNAEDFFSRKRVMVIVPHEDDDLNLMSGVIDNYIQCGSEVYPVFVTNGDYYGLGEERINEAVACWKYLGVPEKNVYFLGYGDRWDSEGPHIYNAPADELLTSGVGRTETYGTAAHPAYHNGNPYTNRNYLNDIKQLILEKKPDVLFISDYDFHVDHKAVSLMSECALGEIFRSSDDYRPIVYKGYAYSTAWHSYDDFFSVNLKSTKEPDPSDCGPMVYNWNDRVRLPVNETSLSRSLFANSSFRAMQYYHSQDAIDNASRIINGDKVFWQRRTDSILYDAKFDATSGDVSYIADFRLIDSYDIDDDDHLPYDRIWTPDKNDKKRTIHVRWKEACDISQINLYDNPSQTDNITKAKITFSDGSSITTGKLNENGSASTVTVNKKNIKSFDIKILAYEGETPGLCEVEAFRSAHQNDSSFLKIIDAEDDFVYYYIAGSDTSVFSLYANNQIAELTDQNYAVICDNDKCSCAIKDGKIRVICPVSESCRVSLRELSSGLTDEVIVSNPGALRRSVLSLGQKIEKDHYYLIVNENYKRMTSYRFLLGILLYFLQ